MQQQHSPLPKVYVSILNWNGYEMTLRCLQSLQSLDYPNYQIIVVDNASTDGSVKHIYQKFPNVQIIPSDTNLGYAGGNRLALDRAMQDKNAELFWILNNDTVVRPNTLSELVEAYRKHGEALYGGVPIHQYDGSDESYLMMYVWKNRKHRVLRNIPFSVYFDTLDERPVEALSGSHMLIPISLIERHGFIDESFFLYCEDVDYCFHLEQTGVKIILVPASIVVHDGGGSHKPHPNLTPIIRYYRARNWIVLSRRYLGLSGYITEISRQLFYALSWILLTVKRGHVAFASACYTLLGIRDAIRNGMGKTYAPEDRLS